MTPLVALWIGLTLLGIAANGHTKPFVRMLERTDGRLGVCSSLVMVYRAPISVIATALLLISTSGMAALDLGALRSWNDIWIASLWGASSTVSFGVTMTLAPSWVVFLGAPLIPVIMAILRQTLGNDPASPVEIIVLAAVFVLYSIALRDSRGHFSAERRFVLYFAAYNIVAYTLYLYYSDRSGQRPFCLVVSSALSCIIGLLFFAVLLLIRHRNSVARELVDPISFPNQKQWLAIGLLGVVQQALPLFIYAHALEILGKQKVAILLSLLGVMGPIVARAWKLEVFISQTKLFALGGVAVIVGSYAWFYVK